MLGEKILAVYFKQLTRPGPMFLDLRLSGFGIANNQVAWNPTSLWSEFSPGFVEGLGDLYGGFYGQDKTRFEKGLEKTGLIQPSWSAEDRDRMATLFRAHFGQALDAPMSFKLETFQKSFQAVFTFLMEKKVHLTTDFLLLGVMLVTLYLSLEELGGEYSVAAIYRTSVT
jgi:predicted unusual protein kinase regulating ubiquinone biosynthesis (AarF/ABC1/UbiB family)